MKVYLDTCILSKLLQDTIPDEQLNALELITQKDQVQMVTSQKTLEEFTNTPDDRRRKSLKILFKIIEKIYAPPHIIHYSGLFGDTPVGVSLVGGGGGSIEDELYSKLKKQFKGADALHVYCAKKNNCEFFMTLDYKTILKPYVNKVEIQEIVYPMRVTDPKGFIENQENDKLSLARSEGFSSY